MKRKDILVKFAVIYAVDNVPYVVYLSEHSIYNDSVTALDAHQIANMDILQTMYIDRANTTYMIIRVA